MLRPQQRLAGSLAIVPEKLFCPSTLLEGTG
jgi:hypothetical protein